MSRQRVDINMTVLTDGRQTREIEVGSISVDPDDVEGARVVFRRMLEEHADDFAYEIWPDE